MTTRARLRPLRNFAAAGLLALGLSGCISLLPKTKPAQLYRFGMAAAPTAAAAQPTATGGVGVFRVPGDFQRESAGDRLLTVTGERAAYIAEARWVAPAEVLFGEALTRAFEGSPGPVRLVSRGEAVGTQYALRLDVRNFEVDYGAAGAPSVLVRIRAVLTRDQARNLVAEQMFEARVPAAENRVTAIVAAYDQALAQVLGQIVGWTGRSAAG